MKWAHIIRSATIFDNEYINPSFQFHTIFSKLTKISVYFLTVTGDIQKAITYFKFCKHFFPLKLPKNTKNQLSKTLNEYNLHIFSQ